MEPRDREHPGGGVNANTEQLPYTESTDKSFFISTEPAEYSEAYSSHGKIYPVFNVDGSAAGAFSSPATEPSTKNSSLFQEPSLVIPKNLSTFSCESSTAVCNFPSAVRSPEKFVSPALWWPPRYLIYALRWWTPFGSSSSLN